MWVANSATLISGERDAVLVDTFLTVGTVANPGGVGGCQRQKPHRDLHYAWARRSLLWPGIAAGMLPPYAKAVATADVVQAMHHQLSPAWYQ